MTTESDPDAPRSTAYLTSLTATVAGAIGVSLCCIGPFVLFALGVTGVHLVEALAPYRPFVVAFELAAYLAYRRYRPEPACDADAPSDTAKQALFWVALVSIVGGLVALGW